MSTCIVQCGKCCQDNYLCEKCSRETLAASGIPESFIERITGKKSKNRNYEWLTEFSEVRFELEKIQKEMKQEQAS